jgi:hypothetical protein
MAVSTAVFPKAPIAAGGGRAQRCADTAVPGGARRGGDAAASRPVPEVDSVTAAAEAILLRERMRTQQLLSSRPLPAARRPGGPAPCPRSAPVRGCRLRRWERLSMTLVVAAAVLVVGLTSWVSSAAPTRDTVVLPGDTMLSIALREMPDVDPARAAELIGAANGSADLQVTPGMTLAIPVGR